MKNRLYKSSPVEAKYTVEQMHAMIVSYLVKKHGIRKGDIKLQSSLREDLWLDSLERVELFMWCEAEFDFHLSDDEAVKINTVEDLFRVVESLGSWLKD